MRKLFSLLLLLAACTLAGRAQTLTALPSATTHAVNLSITNTCASGVTCTFNIYRCSGTVSACPNNGTAIWLLVNPSPLTGLTYSDTAVTQGSTYSYVAYALATVSGTAEQAGPSTEVAATVPLGPTSPGLSVSSTQ